ncbi:17349_t:CDS:2 [Funneliformis geosporum]|uniref:17349_t:CDS:1 n=1 Tax=Funneliformis geosporum TaxID=1117311 RepID=A0A9W4WT03_9GLOM|nr:17349_t:CDS:2 [Funneliformis geosporum]
MDRIPKNIMIGSFVGGRSHVKPMLDICAILIERGHNVMLVTRGNKLLSSEYPTVKHISLGHDLKDLVQNNGIKMDDLIHKKFDIKQLIFMTKFALKMYPESFEIYKNAAKDYNVDLFFCDIMINDACVDAAYILKKPVVGFRMASNTYKSDPMFDCNVSLENDSFLERFRCTIINPLQTLYEMKRENGHNFMSKDRLSTTSLLLADTYFGFEEIGPVLSDKYPPLTPEITDFMNEHKRVLFVALGTNIHTTVENNNILLQSFIESINKGIIDGVIWALVRTSADDFDSTLNLTDGTRVPTLPIRNNEHPHFLLTKFAPQFSILNHINTKLFFSHGGAGSTHESLFTGTPMLVLPVTGDQLGNSEKLELAGIALKLNKLHLDVNDILNKIEFLLNDENVKANSKRLEVLTKFNSKRKYHAADLIEYVLNCNSSSEEFLKEWIPADARMGFIRGNNYDVYGTLLGLIFGIGGGIMWLSFRLIRFGLKKFGSKLKHE